jgi:hypothetical protein
VEEIKVVLLEKEETQREEGMKNSVTSKGDISLTSLLQSQKPPW